MNSTNSHSSHSRSKRAAPARSSSAHHQTSVYDGATTVRFGNSQSTATEDLFLQMWTPGLLDRLQTPLTHYHE
ncbi:MAG TPA: hypothetical protein VK717_00825 [Opitutaceae bacterium]|jgi:hypothetical protein|nr:hypothetical protein [Opitutaceae bacterium]